MCATQPHLPVLTCLFWQVRDFALCLQACMAACLLSLTLSGRISLCACRMASFVSFPPAHPGRDQAGSMPFKTALCLSRFLDFLCSRRIVPFEIS